MKAGPSSACPHRRRLQFFGEAFHADGARPPAGSRVEAYVGDSLCGVAALRGGGSFGGYVISIAGPDAIPGCGLGATIMFTVNRRT